MRKLIVIFSLFLFSYNSIAEEAEMPEFASKPIKYANKNWIRNSVQQKVWVTDEMLVGDFKNERMKFWVYMTGPNYHPCSISGEAVKQSKSTYEFKEDSCTLTIKFSKNKVSLSDPGNTCFEGHCNNEYFDKAEFFKVKN